MKKVICSLIAMTLFFCGLCTSVPSAAMADGGAAPEKIVVTGAHEVAKGCSIQLCAEVMPSDAGQSVKWVSGDPSVATVSKKGLVTGVKAGQTVIAVTSKADSSIKKTWKITVKNRAVRKISVSAPTKTINLGEEKHLQLSVKVSPAAASQSVCWKSSDKKIASVSSKGVVTGKKAGTVTITAEATDGSGAAASIKIKVRAETKYYALIIGNANYTEIDTLPSARNGSKAFANAMKGFSQPWKITFKQDLTGKQIQSAIKEAFRGATADDVCLFFYAGHGGNDPDWEPGALQGIHFIGDTPYQDDLLSANKLAAALDRTCPGKTIVILDSCGSGSYIYEGDTSSSASSTVFNNAILRAFSGKTDYRGTGDLLGEKYTVLTACEHGDYGWNVKMDGRIVGTFTWCLLQAMGCKFPGGSYTGSMPADTNGDKALSLQETMKAAKTAYKTVLKNYPDLEQQVFCSHGDPDMILFRR